MNAPFPQPRTQQLADLGLALDLALANLRNAQSQRPGGQEESDALDAVEEMQGRYSNLLSLITGQDAETILRRMG